MSHDLTKMCLYKQVSQQCSSSPYNSADRGELKRACITFFGMGVIVNGVNGALAKTTINLDFVNMLEVHCSGDG